MAVLGQKTELINNTHFFSFVTFNYDGSQEDFEIDQSFDDSANAFAFRVSGSGAVPAVTAQGTADASTFLQTVRVASGSPAGQLVIVIYHGASLASVKG